MKRTPADHVVQFLSFSDTYADSIMALSRLNEATWRDLLRWVDDTGLAFYFLQKLQNTNTSDAIPIWVLSRLKQSYIDNRERVEDMSRRFETLNHRLTNAGVRFVVLKGLSLVPQFCPDLYLRHQGDFDYLIDEDSVAAAEKALLHAGYSLKPPTSDQEFIFVLPRREMPSESYDQYSSRAPHAVELHLDIWDREQHRLPPMRPLFSVDRATIRRWRDVTFPVLAEEDAFLLQVLHACQHLFTYWIRMSSLYEIGFFLNHRGSDTRLWTRVEERVGDNRILREFVVLITELVAQLFAAPVPELVQEWGRRVQPATRVWIENYSRECAFSEAPVSKFHSLPASKLVLFLLDQYKDATSQRHVVRSRLIAPNRFSRMASSIRQRPSLLWNMNWWKRQRLVQRSLFHALSGLRYFYEVPRWKWRNWVAG